MFIWAHSSYSLYFDVQGGRNRLEWLWAQLAAGADANSSLAQIGGHVALLQVAKGDYEVIAFSLLIAGAKVDFPTVSHEHTGLVKWMNARRESFNRAKLHAYAVVFPGVEFSEGGEECLRRLYPIRRNVPYYRPAN